MASLISRRAAIVAGSQVLVGVCLAGQPERVSNGRERPAVDLKMVPDKGARLDSKLVFEFVYFAHSNLEVVKDMLADTPALVNSAWDWGGGDWETALGAAGHMGRRDVAEVLIASGARVELPCAAMLGELEFVKAALTAWPRAARTPGPHGIPLIAHAKKGGERAKGVLDFLEGLEKGR